MLTDERNQCREVSRAHRRTEPMQGSVTCSQTNGTNAGTCHVLTDERKQCREVTRAHRHKVTLLCWWVFGRRDCGPSHCGRTEAQATAHRTSFIYEPLIPALVIRPTVLTAENYRKCSKCFSFFLPRSELPLFLRTVGRNEKFQP